MQNTYTPVPVCETWGTILYDPCTWVFLGIARDFTLAEIQCGEQRTAGFSLYTKVPKVPFDLLPPCFYLLCLTACRIWTAQASLSCEVVLGAVPRANILVFLQGSHPSARSASPCILWGLGAPAPQGLLLPKDRKAPDSPPWGDSTEMGKPS